MTTTDYNKTVDIYADNVYRFVLKSLKDPDGAQDVVQEAYERLWVNVGKVDADKAKAYLFTIAYRLLIDEVRRNKKVAQYQIDNPAGDEAYTDTSGDLNAVLHRALAQLPAIQRSVVLLRDYEGYTYQEIGEITGLNEPQVKVYIYRARLFLKQHIGKLETIL